MSYVKYSDFGILKLILNRNSELCIRLLICPRSPLSLPPSLHLRQCLRRNPLLMEAERLAFFAEVTDSYRFGYEGWKLANAYAEVSCRRHASAPKSATTQELGRARPKACLPELGRSQPCSLVRWKPRSTFHSHHRLSTGGRWWCLCD